MHNRDGVQGMAANEAVEVVNWTHQPAWLSPDVSQAWMQRCVQLISWDQPEVRVYGQWHRVPRLTSFLADRQVSYRYSGAVHRGAGWPDWFCLCWSVSHRRVQHHSMAVFSTFIAMVTTEWGGMRMMNRRLMHRFRLLPCRWDQAETCSFAIA